MVLSMASKSVILAILVSRRKNHLDDPLTFLTRKLLICLFKLPALVCVSYKYHIIDICKIQQLRYQFLYQAHSRVINDIGQN